MGIPNLAKEAFVVNGNTDTERALLSNVEMRVQNILMNTDFLKAFRLTATAANIIQMPDAAVGIYRLADRLMYSSGYGLRGWNHETGAQKRNQRVRSASLHLDHIISIEYQVREFDMNRFLNSAPNVRASILQDWASSVTINALFNLEAYFLEAVKDYYTLRYGAELANGATNDTQTSILRLDLEGITNEAEAKEAFYKVAEWMIDKTTTITLNEIGTSRADWDIMLSPKSMMQLTRAYTQMIGTGVGADSLASGELYKNSILGTLVSEHNWLNKDFPIAANADGTIINEAGINETRDFNILNTHGMALHRQNAAMPINMQRFVSLIDNQTGEPKFIGRMLFALPMFLRPALGFLIMPTYPTTEEIELAKSRVFNKNISSSDSNQITSADANGNLVVSNKYTFQVADYDIVVNDFLTAGGGELRSRNDIELTNKIAELEKQNKSLSEIVNATKTKKEEVKGE